MQYFRKCLNTNTSSSLRPLDQKSHILIVHVHNAHVHNHSTDPQGNTNTLLSTLLNCDRPWENQQKGDDTGTLF